MPFDFLRGSLFECFPLFDDPVDPGEGRQSGINLRLQLAEQFFDFPAGL